MNQLNQGESSGGLPLKRKRGRPRKDPSLKKRPEAAHPPPPGFEGAREHPQRPEVRQAPDPMVGQTVTGVVEATFDAGYILNVRIGNSTSNLRGLVFKQGHFMPVTAENDVAPHLQMIGRNDIRAPMGLAIQPVGARPQKRKYRRKAAAVATPSAVPPVGVRGTLVPVVLQAVNGAPTSNQMPPSGPQSGQLMAFGDKDVHMVEPLSMLPPDQSIPVGQIFLGTQQAVSNHQASVQNAQLMNEQLNEVTIEFGQGEKIEEPMESTETDNTDSSETSDTQVDSGKEAVKSPVEDSGAVWKQETGNSEEGPFSTESLPTDSALKPMFNYGPGRMTELLQALQVNMKDNQVHIAEQPASNIDFHETRAETEPTNEASAP